MQSSGNMSARHADSGKPKMLIKLPSGSRIIVDIRTIESWDSDHTMSTPCVLLVLPSSRQDSHSVIR
jgi:hypothetical protein